MTARIQIKRHNSNVIEMVEIPQDVVPWLEIITVCKDTRVNLMKHKNELLDYLSGSHIPGASLIVRMLKHYKKVELVKS